MRMRASWRDPYRGVPLMFTSSSPGCSLRDRAAFPPSSTWQRDGRQGGTTPKVSPNPPPNPSPYPNGAPGCLHPGHPAADARDLRCPPQSHEFLSKERARGEEERGGGGKKNVPSQQIPPRARAAQGLFVPGTHGGFPASPVRMLPQLPPQGLGAKPPAQGFAPKTPGAFSADPKATRGVTRRREAPTLPVGSPPCPAEERALPAAPAWAAASPAAGGPPPLPGTPGVGLGAPRATQPPGCGVGEPAVGRTPAFTLGPNGGTAAVPAR